MKKIMAALILGSLAYSLNMSPSIAARPVSVLGSVRFVREVDRQDAPAAKKWFNKITQTAEQQLTALYEAKNMDKTKLNGLREKASKILTEKPDGSLAFITPMPFIEVQIGEISVKTDDKGVFIVPRLLPGDYEVALSLKDKIFYRESVHITTDTESLNIDVPLFQSTTNVGGNEPQVGIMSEGIMRYAPYPIGTLLGIYPGRMKILTDSTNMVNCNKADESFKAPNDDTGNFPNNNSDCSRSIGYGMLYAQDPYTYFPYINSAYCYYRSYREYGPGKQ